MNPWLICALRGQSMDWTNLELFVDCALIYTDLVNGCGLIGPFRLAHDQCSFKKGMDCLRT